MTLVENDDIARLWTLVGELSSQIAENRERAQALQQQADELKGQAIHSTTGYALRRFNVDISKEKFESELERINAQLVYENNILAHENKQTAILLREYEQALEAVMAKFRAFTHATQTHTLQMTSYYESLLSANAHAAAEAQLQASTSFNGKLSRLGNLVRTALRSMDGEVEEFDDEDEEQEHHAAEQNGYLAAATPWSDAISSSSDPSVRSKSTRFRPQAFGSAGTDPRWFGMGGGYTGRDGDPAAHQSERALERMTEEERLRYENEMLRTLLGIQEAKVEPQRPASTTAGAGPTSSASPSTSGAAAPQALHAAALPPPAYTNTNAVPPAGTPLLGIRVEEVADADDDDDDDDDDDEDDDETAALEAEIREQEAAQAAKEEEEMSEKVHGRVGGDGQGEGEEEDDDEEEEGEIVVAELKEAEEDDHDEDDADVKAVGAAGDADGTEAASGKSGTGATDNPVPPTQAAELGAEPEAEGAKKGNST